MIQYTLFPTTLTPKYGGHEGYTPSIFWLKKAYDRVLNDPYCFSREDAYIRFGVSRSMLRAIAYWAEAFKVIECWDNKEKAYQVTSFGTSLLDLETGVDPYLEDEQTLWLLHWNLLKAPCMSKVWSWFFHQSNTTEEWDSVLLTDLQAWAKAQGDKVAESTLKADLGCLIKMYALPSALKERDIEDALMRPFPDLKLPNHERTPDTFKLENLGGLVRINRGSKPGLSNDVVGYACLDYAGQMGESSIKLERLLYQPDCPNSALPLSLGRWDEVWEYLSQVEGLTVSFDPGLNQLQWSKPISDLKAVLWRRIYHRD